MIQTNTDNSNKSKNLPSVPSKDLDHRGRQHENSLISKLPNERTAD